MDGVPLPLALEPQVKLFAGNWKNMMPGRSLVNKDHVEIHR